MSLKARGRLAVRHGQTLKGNAVQSWNVIRVRTGTDFEVCEALCNVDLATFALHYDKSIIHSRTKAKITKTFPLLSGYIFCAVPDAWWPFVKRQAGVLGPLRGNEGKGLPLTIRASEMDRLMLAQERNAFDELGKSDCLPFGVGDTVSVEVFEMKMQAVIQSIEGNEATASLLFGGKKTQVTKRVTQFGAAQAA